MKSKEWVMHGAILFGFISSILLGVLNPHISTVTIEKKESLSTFSSPVNFPN